MFSNPGFCSVQLLESQSSLQPMGFKKQTLRAILWLAGVLLVLEAAVHLTAEILWFEELGYLQIFLLRFKTQAGLWALTTAIASIFWLGNMAIAHRLKHSAKTVPDSGQYQAKIAKNSPIAISSSSIELPGLLLLLLILSLLVSLMVFYYGAVAARSAIAMNLRDSLPVLPNQFGWSAIWQIAQQLPEHRWQLGLLLGIIFTLFLNPWLSLQAIALLMSFAFGLIASNQWEKVWQYFHSIHFNIAEPIFNKDISFYIFFLPLCETIILGLVGLTLYGLISCIFIYLVSENSISKGRFLGFSQPQQRHLYGLGAAFMLSASLRYWLARYQLLYSKEGVTYGANYTDVVVKLPVNTLLSLFAVVIALILLWKSFNLNSRKPHLITKIVLGFFLIEFFAGLFLPKMVQRLGVQPNELARERPYIQRSITFTQQGFNLNKIEIKTFDPTGKLTTNDLKKNQQTINNIRLWDKRPLLQTNRQLQQIRPYYKFPDADIDRYTLPKENRPKGETQSQQVLIAARELDYTEVSPDAKTWVNEHLVYTHGYGFTMSPVNTVGAGGLPDYFIKDIGVNLGSNNQTTLDVSSEQIRTSIPIGYPRIYYGEITDTQVMTPSREKEFDYPSGNENVYNTYDGSGGIPIGSIWRRWLFATYLNNWEMVLTRNFNPQTKVLLRRNINQRVRAIAPFLRYDSDPYLVVANTNLDSSDRPTNEVRTDRASNYLYWIIDAYTFSDRYPYSDPGEHPFNYIRNSVKVVIDAYNGSVSFYVADPSDPIIQSWMEIFPQLFKPLKAMPSPLRSHIRYPVDLFTIQSERLLTYHMEDSQVFYNREDLWRVPNEIYGSEQQLVQPYYLILKLPTETSEEFILLLPFTPIARNNLIAWLAGRSDGEDYGKLLLYQFPKQRLVYGPEQIEALINQDPQISEQISLWNRQGSRALQGNLLVIPIEQSLLYVEPLYLEATRNSLPTLVRVIVAYENRIVMAETLDEALQAVFQQKPSKEPAIVRPVEGTVPNL